MFSVLMSVYFREDSDSLRLSLESLVSQTLSPTEIVLVKDGLLTPKLDDVISEYSRRLPMKLVQLPENQGLASALNAGLVACSEDWIMRFDSDDICVPDRVEQQAKMIEADDSLGLIGGQIEEFDPKQTRPTCVRRVPCDHEEIMRFGLHRNPFNHMTVCFRRSAALAAGGYPNVRYFEDYALWAMLLNAGVRAANSPQILVKARAGRPLIQRRGGVAYVRSELKLQRMLCETGFKSLWMALGDAVIRSTAFMLPIAAREQIYRRLMRTVR